MISVFLLIMVLGGIYTMNSNEGSARVRRRIVYESVGQSSESPVVVRSFTPEESVAYISAVEGLNKGQDPTGSDSEQPPSFEPLQWPLGEALGNGDFYQSSDSSLGVTAVEEPARSSGDDKWTLAAAVPVAKPTRAPTAPPTVSNVKNATIVNGYLTIYGVTSYVGRNSSNINAVIQKYFPKTSYTQMTLNTKYTVWMNASVALSYLILVGNYTADVPIVLPHQFILVMNRASLIAVANFPTNVNSISVGG